MFISIWWITCQNVWYKLAQAWSIDGLWWIRKLSIQYTNISYNTCDPNWCIDVKETISCKILWTCLLPPISDKVCACDKVKLVAQCEEY